MSLGGDLSPSVHALANSRRHRNRSLCMRLSLSDFTWQGPTGEIALPGESEGVFMRKLGLDDRLQYHKELFQAMLQEAKQGYMRLPDDAEITPLAIDSIVEFVLNNASPKTSCMYEVARRDSDNWVIRWLLWHALDARDTSMSHPSA